MNPQTPKEKNSKGGRPKKPENELRLYPVKVYFDEANHRKLMNRSRRTGQPLSTIVYELAINGYVREPFTKEEVSMLRSLSGMANNRCHGRQWLALASLSSQETRYHPGLRWQHNLP